MGIRLGIMGLLRSILMGCCRIRKKKRSRNKKKKGLRNKRRGRL